MAGDLDRSVGHARRLLEDSCPGTRGWDAALAHLASAADPVAVRALARQLNASDARRWLTAHVIAASLRWRDGATTLAADRFLSDLDAALVAAGLSAPATRALGAAVAAAAASLARLAGPRLSGVRETVWRICFGASLYEAPWHWRDLRDQSVLILGETGTGKELVAQTIALANVWCSFTLAEDTGGRSAAPEQPPMIVFNAAAVPAALAEAELFGAMKGAFTDAKNSRVGHIERAHGGTLFMDEIGDLPREVVPKLLRVIEDHAVVPLGGDAARPRPACARWVTATSRDVDRLIADGRWSEDFRQRLAALQVTLPPLRTWDVTQVRDLAREHLTSTENSWSPWHPPGALAAANRSIGAQPADTGINSPAYRARMLARFDEQLGVWLLDKARAWPGNVRQLFHVVRTWRTQGAAQSQAELEKVPEQRVDGASPLGRAEEGVVAELRRRVLDGAATMSEVEAWYVEHSRRPDESLRAHASRLGIDPKTVNRMRADLEVRAAAFDRAPKPT